MTIQFVVEDGTGKLDATSYITVAELKQYADNVGYNYSVFSDEQIQQKLNKVTKDFEILFGTYFTDYKTVSNQRLSFPRTNCEIKDGDKFNYPYYGYSNGYLAFDNSNNYCFFYLNRKFVAPNTIPERLKDAICELFFDNESSNLVKNVEAGQLKRKKSIVGSEKEWFPTSQTNTIYSRPMMLVSIYFQNNTNESKLIY